MNKKLIIFSVAVVYIFGFVSLHSTQSFYSDSATIGNNVFSASSEFPITSPQLPSPTPVPLANHLVISEVQITGGSGDAKHDFVEFYNPTGSNYDLNGHRLVKRTGDAPTDTTIKSWTSSTIIPAYSFYLWASSDDSTYPSSIGADVSTTPGLTASNSIALRNGAENTGTIIDALSWNSGSTLGEGTVYSPDPGGNQSLERKAYSTSTASTMEGGADALKGNGFDANNNSTDFILRNVSQPQNSASATETP